MRQKKSNIIYYIIALLVISVMCFVTFTEFPFEVTHVEEIVK